ncbi:MAG: ATP-binding protein [Gammaproteobacteria bacterium]|nr:ATP-binding protein [Gammaproteobacteria bacterium]
MFTSANTQNDLEVLNVQVSQLYEPMGKALFVTVLNSSILVIVLWPAVERNFLLSWLFSIVFVSVLRGVSAYQYKASSIPISDVHIWHQRFLMGSIAASFLWGASSFWVFPAGDLARQVFHAFVIGGMAASAVATLSYNRLAINTFLTLSLVPLMIQFFANDANLSHSMGAMLALYYVMMLQSAKLTHNKYIENIQTRIENLNQLNSLNESDQRYKILLDSATDAFFLHDLKGKLLDVNRQACHSLGYSKDELLKLKVADIDVESTKPKINWNKLKEGENIRFDSVHQRKDGSTFPVEVSLGYITMDDKPLVSVLARDITERKRVEKMKNEFISTVSHELRTPLTSIKGGLGLLKGGAVGDIPEQAQEILSIACHNTEALMLLVNDILDMQKVESPDMEIEFEEIAVIPFLQQVIDDNKAYAEQYKVKIILKAGDNELYLNANKARLKQVMANLISNAAKFSHENGTVEIVVSRPDDKLIRIAVNDHGIGIAEEFYPAIFDKFTQQDSSDTRQKGGTGLGLSITKAIIEKHGGEIAFVSKQGEGTTFYFDLPEFVNDSK